MKKAWRYHRNGVKNSLCWSAMLVAGLTYLLVTITSARATLCTG
jgi:hypothetical protein